MTLGMILRQKAERDIEFARNWYDAQQVGLGEEFLSAVQERLVEIRRFPESCPEIHKKLRRALVGRFPYLIFYLLTQDKVVVLAVLHTSRDPANWPKH